MSGPQELVLLSRPNAIRVGEVLERWRLRRRRVEEAEQREGEEPMQDGPLPRRAGDARARLLAQEEIQVDQELDVGVVGLSLEQARRQDEQVVALKSLAQEVLGRARQASELDAGRAVRAEEDGRVERPHGAAHGRESVRESRLPDVPGAQSGHDGLVRLPPDGQRRVLPDHFLLGLDRKSTRLNSSHLGISYAVFCLKKKKKEK